jgi:hypothetical protein
MLAFVINSLKRKYAEFSGVGQPSELASVREEIKEAKTKREECTADFKAATSDSKEQFFAKRADALDKELATLREEVVRFQASSALSCATSVVRKHF